MSTHLPHLIPGLSCKREFAFLVCPLLGCLIFYFNKGKKTVSDRKNPDINLELRVLLALSSPPRRTTVSFVAYCCSTQCLQTFDLLS